MSSPWDHRDPLVLTLADFEAEPFCPKCGWPPDDHCRFVPGTWGPISDWACPTEKRTPVEWLAQVQLQEPKT